MTEVLAIIDDLFFVSKLLETARQVGAQHRRTVPPNRPSGPVQSRRNLREV